MNRFWPTLVTVLRKEILDALRDRRSVIAVFVLSLVSPGILLLMIKRGEEIVDEAAHVELAVAGIDHAPALVMSLRNRGITVVEPPADAQAAVQRKELEFFLQIPKDYAKQLHNGENVELEIVYGDLRQEAKAQLATVREAIGAHASELGVLRLALRGIAPAILRPYSIVETNVAQGGGRISGFLSIFIFMLFAAAFSGSMYVAIDSSAGERERGTLEPLLIATSSLPGLVGGKVLSVFFFAAAATVFSLASSAVVLAATPSAIGVVEPTLVQTIGTVAVVFSALPLLAAGQLFAYFFARSHREAGVYASFVMLLPTFGGAAQMMYEVRADAMLTVPYLGQMDAARRLLSGETLPLGLTLIGAGLSLALAGVCMASTVHMLRQEKTIFAR